MRLCIEERVLLIVLGLTVGGAMLLISAARGTEEGQRPWRRGSVLHQVTRIMNFDGAYPTPKGAGVKRLAGGLGASAALIIAALLWCRRHNPRPADSAEPVGPNAVAPAASGKRWYDVLTPAEAAQLAMLAFAGWSFVSASWSRWPEVAVGESVLLAIGVIWAICLGRALSRRAAMIGAVILLVILTATAAIGVWYFYERNPLQRLKFPVGNPLFMAACLIPGILLSCALAVGAAAMAIAGRRLRWLLWVAPAAAALVPLLWALRLTGSRGAIVGLAAGGWAAALLLIIWWLRSRTASRRAEPLVLAVALAVAAAGLYFGWHRVRAGMSDPQGGRGGTLRLRHYAWGYAWNLFLLKPAGGHGQGGYTLLADAMARPDAEQDPAAFLSARLVHAHNEWLEILADLGAVGFTLVIVGYGATLWACWHAVGRRNHSIREWCLLGLAAALVALMVEESTDVALRVPGLPVVWYTVLGLVWALMRTDDGPADRVTPFPRPVLWVGTGAAFATAITLFVWVAGNWRGALADARVGPLLEDGRWSEAATQAEAAGHARLGADEIMESLAQKVHCHAAIGEFYASTLPGPAPGREGEKASLTALQQDNLMTARTHALAARQDAVFLLTRAPGFPDVAGAVGRLLLIWMAVEERVAELAANQINQIREEARQFILAEYGRYRIDTDAALQCVLTWPDRPVEDRIEWLCTGLRGSMEPGASEHYRAVVADVMDDPAFEVAVQRRAEAARGCVGMPEARTWPDAYAPEALRLWGITRALRGYGRDAGTAAGEAAELYTRIRVTNPALVSVALAEQAEYVFRTDPDRPQEARRIAIRAIAEVPPIGTREQLIAPIRRALVLYYLADGQEAEAVSLLAEALETDEQDVLLNQIGLAYTELCGQYLAVPPERRPVRLSTWVERAVRLAPESRDLHFVRAQLAFEAGRDEEVVRLLQAAESLGVAPDRINAVVMQALEQRPGSAALRRFAESRRVAPPATAPAATAPAESRPVATRRAPPTRPAE